METKEQTSQNENKFELAVNRLESSLLKNKSSEIFERAFLEKLQREHLDLPQRYLIDFLHQAQISGANPVSKEVYLVSYFDKTLGHKVGSTIHSYHFFASQAERTGELDSISVESAVEEVFQPFTGEKKEELVSTCIVNRKGKDYKFKARWSEFKKDNSQWRSKPYIMLEKCARANAMRMAFPNVLSGLYIEEEMPFGDDKKIDLSKQESTETNFKVLDISQD